MALMDLNLCHWQVQRLMHDQWQTVYAGTEAAAKQYLLNLLYQEGTHRLLDALGEEITQVSFIRPRGLKDFDVSCLD